MAFFQSHHRHSSHQPRSSSHQRSSNSSSSSASAAAPRNNSFEPGYHRTKRGGTVPNHQSKMASTSTKKKGGASGGGQNNQFTQKFSHPHGNIGNTNLRVPPPASNKMMTAQINMNGGGISNHNGVNNNTKGKVTLMKAPPSHYVLVQRLGQNTVDHNRHHAKQPPK